MWTIEKIIVELCDELALPSSGMEQQVRSGFPGRMDRPPALGRSRANCRDSSWIAVSTILPDRTQWVIREDPPFGLAVAARPDADPRRPCTPPCTC